MSATASEKENLPAALTTLTEEEELFRASVREFAEGEVLPRVEQMEHSGKIDPDLISQIFELGLCRSNTGGIRRRRFVIFYALLVLRNLRASMLAFRLVTSIHARHNAFCAGDTTNIRTYLPRMFESVIGATLVEAGALGRLA